MMASSEDRPFVSRKRLIDLLGAEAAARVVDVFGGRRVYMPAPDTDSYTAMVQRFGDTIARKLCVEFGGTQVFFPQRLVGKRSEILALRAAKITPSEIARRTKATESYVYYVLRQDRP